MKKLLYLFSASLFVLISCTKDETATATLVKKITYTESNGAEVTSEVTYNGNKIVQVVEGTDKTVYTYTGDLITKEETNGRDIVEYSYENNKLKMRLSTRSSGSQTYKSKNVYTHNSDGTVDYGYYETDVTTGVETLYTSGKVTFSNGNLVKDVTTGYSSTYEYDTKNNPFKNIVGFGKLMGEEFSVNNVVKRTSTYNGSTPSVSTNEYDYNADGYPIVQRSFYNGGTADGVIKYFY